MKFAIEAVFLLINAIIAKYQAYRFDKQQKRINHTLWAFYYACLLVPVQLIYKNWWLTGVCALQHLPAFNTLLNYFRTPRRPIFYTHPEDPEGSLIDRIWGRFYPIVFAVCSVAIIVMQFIL